MGKIIIYDSNNWVRMTVEKDFTGLGIRMCWSEAIKDDGNTRIFVFDGRGGNQLRRSIYPEYKVKRKLPTDNFFENLSFFKELLRYAPKNVGVVEREGFEGDDVIYTIAKGMYPAEVTIISTDKDLTAIKNAVNPLVSNALCDKKYVHLYKTLVGDPSDNIKGVIGFGKKTFELLSEEEKNVLNRYFESDLSESEAINCSIINPKVWNLIQKTDDQTLRNNWAITSFFEVPNLEISWGENKIELSEQMLKEVML